VSGVPLSILHAPVFFTVLAASHAFTPAPWPKHAAIPASARRSAPTSTLWSIDEDDSSRDARVLRMIRSADATIVGVAQRAATHAEKKPLTMAALVLTVKAA